MTKLDYYALLGVSAYASAREIDQAYRTLADRLGSGPDGSPALLDLIRDAHQTLSDPRQRAAYDHGRTAPTVPPAPAVPPAVTVPPRQPAYIPVHDEIWLRYVKRWRRRWRIFGLCVLLILLLILFFYWASTFPT